MNALRKLYKDSQFNNQLKLSFSSFVMILVSLSLAIAALDLLGTALIAISLQNLGNFESIHIMGDLYVSIYHVIAILILRVFFTTFLLYIQGDIVYRFMAIISQSVINKIILTKGTDQRIDNDKVMQLCVTESNNIGVGYLLPLVSVATEILIVLAMTVYIYSVIGIQFVGLSVLILLLSLIYLISIRPYLKRLGNRRLVVENDRISLINFITYGIRELFCYGVESKFTSRYQRYSFESAGIGNRQQVLKNAQKYWLEASGIVSILLLVWFSPGLGMDELILLGLYGYKVVPSANRITAGLSSITYYSSSIKLVNYHANH